MFIVNLHYIVPLQEVDAHIPAHRAWLDEQYAKGIFLLSGPKSPRDGGIIVARAASRDALAQVLATDPFAVHGVARADIIEFTPSLRAAELDGIAL
jgi:uncharacterized protein YciI